MGDTMWTRNRHRLRPQRLLKPAVWVLLSLPLAWLAGAIFLEARSPGSALGADPGEAVLLFLGEWGIRALLLALSISTLRRWFDYAPLVRIRRLVGLFAFPYLSLHFSFYLWFFTVFDWGLIREDLVERPYITLGFAALLMLLLLAVTSTRGWQRRLRRRWRQLHRLIYPACALGVLHFWWLTKDGYGEVALYALWLAVLYGDRLLAMRGKAGQHIRRKES